MAEVSPKTVRVLRVSCSHLDGGFRVHLTDADWDALVEEFDTLQRLNEDLERKLMSAEEQLAHMRDLAQGLSDEGCWYGDGCPTFGSRHGTCHACMGRKALGHGDKARARMAQEDKEAE